MKKLLFSVTVTVGKAMNFAGRFLLEAATAIGLLACAACARMGLSAIIHAESGSHWFPETYWSGREEWYCGMTALVVSVAVAIFIAYWRYVVSTGDDDMVASDDDAQEATKTPADGCRGEQDAISFLYFLGFAIVSIIWTIATSPENTHWDDFMVGKVARSSAITAFICVVFMFAGGLLSSSYTEEETKA